MEIDTAASRHLGGGMPFGDDSDSAVSTPPQSPVHPSGVSASYNTSLLQQQQPNVSKPSPSVPAKRKDPTDPNAPPKKPRKSKKKDADGTTAATTQNADGSDKPKEKKPRKPRDPNAPPRKRNKSNVDAGPARPADALNTQNLQGSATTTTPHSALHNNTNDSITPTFAQIGKSEAAKTPIAANPGVTSQIQQLNHTYTPSSTTPAPAPPSNTISRPRYDPIRSASAENAANAELVNYASPPHRTPVSTHARASASITNLLSDPSETYMSPRPYSSTPRPYDARASQPPSPAYSQIPAASTAPSTNGYTSMPPPPKPVTETPKPVEAVVINKPVLPSNEPSFSPAPVKPKASKPSKVDTTMQTSSPKPAAPKSKSPSGFAVIGNGPPNSATIIKPPPPKKERPPVQPVINDCIIIEVPKTGPTGNYCNFLKEVEAKYGFDVAYPRVAEHKKRMAQMASLGAALEGGAVSTSGDEMALDDDEMDSNAEMGGMDGGAGESTAAEGGAAAKKKRRAKANEYDKTDDFIDDAEQAWEEQALASKDGYFVWMGPLVPEEEKTDGDKAGTKGGRGTKGKTKAGDANGKGSKTSGAARVGKGGAEPGKRKPRATKAEMEERRAAKAAKEAAKEAKEEKDVKNVVTEEASK